MTIPPTQPTSFYLLVTILLGYQLGNLQACPLPANASCSECDALRYIQLGHNNLNINLSALIDINLSLNTIIDFSHTINSVERHDFSFRISSTGSVGDCLGDDPNAGTPCTHHLQMEGDSLPRCQWNYTCDYSPNRFPQYLWRAQCADNAHPIFYRIPVLTLEPGTEDGCIPFSSAHAVYRWGMEKVAVACSCNSA